MAEQYQVKNNSVTLYLNNIAHITASVELKKAQDRVNLLGIAPEFELETLHPIFGSKKIKILEAMVLEATTLKEIAESLIGRKIYDREANKYVKNLGVEGNNLLVKGASDLLYAKPLTAFDYKTDEEIRERKALQLKLQGIGNEKQILELSYLTNGITLTPHYNITLINKRLALASAVEVKNRTGEAYKDVELEVVPGDVETPYLPRGRPPKIMRLEAMALTAEGVKSFEEEGQIRYTFGRKNLPKGDSRFNFGELKKKLNYKIIYRTNLGNQEKPDISAVLRFKAPVTLTAGSVAVYSEKTISGESKLIERYEGGGAIKNPVLKGKNANIKLRTPDTLEIKVEQTGHTKHVKTKTKPVFAFEKGYKVTAANAGQDEVTIETYLELSETEKIVKTNLQQHKKSSKRQIRWDVTVKPGKETTFSYKIQDFGFKPIPEDEIKAILDIEDS